LSWKLRALNYNARFIELASEINTNMPRYVVSRVQDALNERPDGGESKPLKGSHLLVLGAAYKPDIDDLRESPALDVIGLLEQKGASVAYHDPYIPHFRHDGMEMHSVSDLYPAVEQADCVIVITNHKVYNYAEILQRANLIVDTRNAFGAAGLSNPKIVKL
jgi:UDP-N-acetyl-D-glucosamine dehydrogenase